MDGPTIELLAARLDQMERERRRARRRAALACVGAFCLLGMGADPTTDRLFARTFAVVDLAGNLRGTFGVGPDGMPSLALMDKAKRVRLMIAVGTDGTPAVTLVDRDQSPRALLSLAENAPGFTLMDPGGKGRLYAGLNPDDHSPFLKLMDANDTVRIEADLEKDGSPGFVLAK
jgi:hypothetical protein